MFKGYVPSFFRIPKHPDIKNSEILSKSIKDGLIAGMETKDEKLSATIKKINVYQEMDNLGGK